jgi:putative sterol carrier protein
MQAFMSGKVKVEGDMSKILAMQAQQAQAGPLAAEVLARVKDMTLE